MKLKYSKFEINMWDIFFLVIYLSHLLGGIDILFNKKKGWNNFFGYWNKLFCIQISFGDDY